MRITVVAGTVATIFALFPGIGTAEAAERRTPLRRTVAPAVPDRPPAQVRNEYSYRAHDADPAGNYKNYPDWARVALGGQSSSR